MALSLQQLIAVLTTNKVRRETLHGRSFLVAKATLLVPGVLDGSEGPLLYTPRQVGRDPSAWNGIPIVANHPTKNGKPVSARHPSVLAKSGLGQIFKSEFDGVHSAEAWFDEELTKNYDRQNGTDIFGKVSRGEKIELSTGVFTKNVKRPGKFKSKSYIGLATRLKPDHLAVLTKGKGACSITDGCGINNAEANKRLDALEAILNADLTLNYIKKEGDKYCVYSHAGKKLGEYDTEAEAKKRLQQIEYFKHKKANNSDTSKGDQTVDKKKMIRTLAANCECWKGQESVLANFSDELLAKLIEEERERRKVVKVANAATKGFKDGKHAYTYNAAKAKFVRNAAPADDAEDAMADCDADDPDCADKKGGKKGPPTGNADAGAEALLKQLGFASLDEAKAVLNTAKRVEKDKRIALVTKLVANVQDPKEKQERGQRLMKKSIDELEDMLALMPKPAVNRRGPEDDEDEDDDNKIDFTGAAGPSRTLAGNKGERPKLRIPRSTWGHVANQRKREAAANSRN